MTVTVKKCLTPSHLRCVSCTTTDVKVSKVECVYLRAFQVSFAILLKVLDGWLLSALLLCRLLGDTRASRTFLLAYSFRTHCLAYSLCAVDVCDHCPDSCTFSTFLCLSVPMYPLSVSLYVYRLSRVFVSYPSMYPLCSVYVLCSRRMCQLSRLRQDERLHVFCVSLYQLPSVFVLYPLPSAYVMCSKRVCPLPRFFLVKRLNIIFIVSVFTAKLIHFVFWTYV